MPLSFEQFLEATKAEVVCGNIIVGVMANRKVVGTHNESFTLNDAGLAIQAAIEDGTYGKEDAAETSEPEAEATEEPDLEGKPTRRSRKEKAADESDAAQA